MQEESFFEKFVSSVADRYKNNRVPFLTGLLVGMVCYGFFFTNKLVQQDDIAAMFAKGTSLTGGRWGLEVMSLVFPDYSMPWIYGIISVVLIAVALCFVINTVKLSSTVFQAIFAALAVSSAAVLGIFTQPYLCTSNALAILMSSVSVYIFACFKDRKKYALGILFLAFSMSIYQAYISYAASLLVVLLMKRLMIDKEQFKTVLLTGIRYFACLLLSLAVYGAATLIINAVFNVELLSYASSDYGIFMRIRVAYTAFAGYFIKRYFSFVNSDVSLAMHAVCIVLSAVAFFRYLEDLGGKEKALGIALMILFPLSINSIYLVSSVNVLSAIVFMSFNSLYLFLFILAEGSKKNVRGIAMLACTVIVICNANFCNAISFKMYMQTSQMKEFCNRIISCVYASGEYEEGDEIAIIGNETDGSYAFDEIDSSNFIGLTAEDVYNIYTRDRFIELYLGVKGPFADVDRKYYLSTLDEFGEMEEFPNSGSIKKIDGTVVVKLG